MRFRHLSRSGTYYRVADPDWSDPLDGLPGVGSGGRWNRPGSFPVVYFNRTIRLARLFVAHKLRGQPYGPEDIDPDSGPVLVDVDLIADVYVDVISDEGCAAVGLPASYPLDAAGEVIPHDQCWPIGETAWNNGEPGIACRSATHRASAADEELAWFQRNRSLVSEKVTPFIDWFFR